MAFHRVAKSCGRSARLLLAKEPPSQSLGSTRVRLLGAHQADCAGMGMARRQAQVGGSVTFEEGSRGSWSTCLSGHQATQGVEGRPGSLETGLESSLSLNGGGEGRSMGGSTTPDG